MALTKFVRNVVDLSDDAGFKFRFHCDKCGDGFESQYVQASANLLKTAIKAFSIFSPLSYGAGTVADSLDKGLRGKERDKAYEQSAHEAMNFFKKCTGCGKWVCPQACWNASFGMCEDCTPNADEQATKQAAQRHQEKVLSQNPQNVASISCPACSEKTGGGKFCQHCGAALAQASCKKCGSKLPPGAKFCGDCGEKN